LKTAEGTARQISEYLRQAMQRTWISQIGAMLAAGGFRILKEKVDPRRSNGGTFLGLNGIVVKSHGGIDAFGFASAVDLAYEMAQRGLIERLAADLEAFHHKLDATATATATAAGPGPVSMSSQAR
jgi:glycerol-3-phosphate acyltransferase PlsX